MSRKSRTRDGSGPSTSKDFPPPLENENDEDEEEINQMFEDIYSNSPEEIKHRRKLREQYRQKREELIQNSERYIHEAGALNEKIEDLNNLYAHVRNPREAVCDSGYLQNIASIGRQRAQHIPVNLVEFLPGTYAEKLVTSMRNNRLIGEEEDEILLQDEWNAFGQKCLSFFRRMPTFHYMFGSFERGEVAPKQRAARVAKKDKDVQGKTVAPKEITKEGQKQEQESTTEEVERILGVLQEYYEKNDNESICLFEFVTNPFSFGHTVENIFHVSFLVKDKYALVYLDVDGLPVIKPTVEERRKATKSKPNKQMVISMTEGEWKEIIKAFKISKPLIPPRRSVGQNTKNTSRRRQ